MNAKAILFDLDGTLLDTLQDIANACNTALVRHGFPPHPIDAYRYFIGEGVPNLVARSVPPHHCSDAPLLARIAATYREEYHRHWQATTRPYPGIPELLDQLAERGLPLVILSNKPDDFTHRCVAEFLPRWSFAAVQGATPEFSPKPDPAAARHLAARLKIAAADFLYLGDTATDMHTATAAGMRAIGVLWGFRPAAELQAAGATRLLEHPGQLLELL